MFRLSGFDLSFVNCVLDVLDKLRVEWHKNQTGENESVFAKVLKYCEVWRRLFSAKGTFE